MAVCVQVVDASRAPKRVPNPLHDPFLASFDVNQYLSVRFPPIPRHGVVPFLEPVMTLTEITGSQKSLCRADVSVFRECRL